MGDPGQYYRDLPPVSKAYGVLCLMASGAFELGLYHPRIIALSYGDVIKRFQIWRLVTNFFFLGPFSFTFAFRLLLIARHGVQLERGPFDKRTADYVWMFIFGALTLLAMAIIPFLYSRFMGASLVFMIVYVWGREFPNDRLNIHGLFELKINCVGPGMLPWIWLHNTTLCDRSKNRRAGAMSNAIKDLIETVRQIVNPCLQQDLRAESVQMASTFRTWYMLGVDLILGNPLMEDLLGIAVGHLYYFLTVLYPLAGGRFNFGTPLWVHKLVAFWGVGYQQNAPVLRQDAAVPDVFQGRGRRLGGR